VKKPSLVLILLLAAAAAFGSYGTQTSTPTRPVWDLPNFTPAEPESASVLLVYDEQGILDLIAYQDADTPFIHVLEPLACEDPDLWGRSQNRATCRLGYGAASGDFSGCAEEFSSILFRHTREYDEETGLYYFRHRYYDPELGRFTQTDPMGYADSMNLYQAFGQSPQNFGDPMGLQTGMTPEAMQKYIFSYYASEEFLNTVHLMSIEKGLTFFSAESRAESIGTLWQSYLTTMSFKKAEMAAWSPETLQAEITKIAGVQYRGTAAPIPIVEKAKQAMGAFLALPGQAQAATQAFWKFQAPNVDPELYAAYYDIYAGMGKGFERTAGDISGAGAKYGTMYLQGEGAGLALKGTFALMGFAAETDLTFVYRSFNEAGEVQYVGITNDLARRAAEHLRSKGIRIRELLRGISRTEAKAVEQALIEIHGLGRTGGTLLNKINSIAQTNSAYAEQLKIGYEMLKKAGY